MLKQIATLLLIPALSLGSAPLTDAKESTVLAQLQTRNRIVVIASSTEGIQYTIKNQQGKILDANLSEQELQAKHPEVYEQVRPAISAKRNSEGPAQPDSKLLMLAPKLE